MTHEERRKNTRVLFQTTASVCFGGGQVCEQLPVRNLSLKGMFVEGIAGHNVGERCEILLFLSGTGSELKLSMQGEVVRVDADGMVVHFSELDIDTFFHLKNIVYYNAADPDQLVDDLLMAAAPDGSFVE
jgi:hypothetical protein